MSTEPAEPASEAAAEDRVARARSRRAKAGDEDDIAPKLPRGGGFKISKGHLFKIGLTTVFLVMLIVIRKPCADSTAKFVTSFDEVGSGSDSAKMPKPGTVDGSGSAQQRYEVIHGDMTEAEMKAAIERAKLRNRGEPSSTGSNEGPATGSSARSTP